MMVGGSGLVVLRSPAPVEAVVAHYREQLPSQGWTVDSVSESSGGTKATIRAHRTHAPRPSASIRARRHRHEISISLKGSN
jgi:hypothetical protein